MNQTWCSLTVMPATSNNPHILRYLVMGLLYWQCLICIW